MGRDIATMTPWTEQAADQVLRPPEESGPKSRLSPWCLWGLYPACGHLSLGAEGTELPALFDSKQSPPAGGQGSSGPAPRSPAYPGSWVGSSLQLSL